MTKTINSINFTSNSGAKNVVGEDINLLGGVANNSTKTQTFSVNIQTNNNNFNTANGNIILNGVLSGRGIVKSGNKDLYVNGNNTFRGRTEVRDGKLIVGHANALGSTGSVLLLSGQSTLDLGGQSINLDPTILGSGYNKTNNDSYIGTGGTSLWFHMDSDSTISNGTITDNTVVPSGVGYNVWGNPGQGAGFLFAESNTTINANLAGTMGIITGQRRYKQSSRSYNTKAFGPVVFNGNITCTGRLYLAEDTVFNNTLTNNLDGVYFRTVTVTSVSEQISPTPTNYTSYTGTASSQTIVTAQLQSAGLGDVSDFSGFVSGRIALIERGVSTFQSKVNNAVAAGASGVVIYNNDTTTPPFMGITANIPVVMISQADGQALLSQLVNGDNITFKLNGQGTAKGSLTFNGNGVNIISGPIIDSLVSNSLASTINFNGSGSLILNSVSNSSMGTINVNSGALQLGDGGVAGTLTASVVNNSNVTFNRSNNQTFSSVISGTGSVTHSGTGITTITGDNTYTGGTTISSGGSITIGSGSTFGSIVGDIVNNGTLTFNRSNPYEFSGIISGTGNVVKTGSNTLTLSGVNSYTGVTTISGGVIRVSNSNSFGSSSSVTQSNTNIVVELVGGINITNNFSINAGITGSGAIRSISGNNTCSGGITLTNNSRINSDSDTLTLSGTISSSASLGLSLGGSGNTLVSGIIAIGGSLTKDGNGTVRLTGANTFAGTTTINAGTLQIGDNGESGSILGSIVLNSGGSLVFDRTNTITYSGVISSTGSIVKQNTGTLILTGTNTHTGSLTISGGTLQLGDGGTTGSTASVITNNGSLVFNRSNQLNQNANISGTGTIVNSGSGALGFYGVISGSCSLENNGSGTMFVLAANTYTGGTTITSGGLTIGNAGSTGSILAGSTNGVILSSGATLTFNRTGTYSDIEAIEGIIQGSGSVVKAASGTLVINRDTHTHSGPLTVSAGVLRINVADALKSTSSITVTSGAALELKTEAGANPTLFYRPISIAGNGVSSGGALRSISGNNLYLGAITLTSNSTISCDSDNLSIIKSLNTSNTMGIQGSISGAYILTFAATGNILVESVIATGTGTLTKNGTGTLVLAEENTFTGTTTINAGTLILGNTTMSGGLLADGTTGSVAGNISATGSLVFDRTNTVTYSGVISGTGSITKQNNNTLILTGANTNTGTFTISGGTVQIGSGGTTGSVASSIANNSSLVFNRSNSITHSAVISGTGSVTNSGTGTTTFTGANTYTGGTIISSGTMQIGASGATGSIVGDVTNNGILTFSRSNSYEFSGVISGTGNVTKSGTGTTTLSGDSTYSGTTTISTGALRISHSNALGSTSGVTINSNTALELIGGITLSRNLTSNGTGTTTTTGSLRNISGNNTLDGNYTLTNTSRINSDLDTLTLSSNGTFTGAARAITFGGSGNILVQRPIATTTGAVTKDGSGTLVLSAANTYTGNTTLNGGTTRFATVSSLYNNTAANWVKTKIIVNTGAVFALNVGGENEFTTSNVTTLLTNLLTTINNNGLRSGSSIGFDTTNSSSDFTISNNITDSTGTGAGAVGVVKLGTGTLILSGNSTYTGGSTVNAGTLKAGSVSCFGTGTITVNSGATLDKAGFSITNTIVNNGGTVID